MQILIKPLISEKSMTGNTVGKYVFVVDIKANKVQVAEEIMNIYKVDVTKVNIIKVKPTSKLVKGKFAAKIKSYKKAVITLKKGQKIPGFEEK
ncbi:MAG: 50S ribosomal protein L23 [Berkelbacteria bacterium GW2011_GWB1_38_5]|uniref:Large ribosomal subunit protein uL23 n=2 Tax=Candidatus Berkelbacteria TaxID=1618330 RepID=A0A0G0LSL8_9BACT|nr:MAG: 50S ribosomal protein L23 [Berkelbacteria bacterium GW2011_GWB1_38_5]KKQ90975.1 MAG: 50S ribosomal protein L23 [Berkelbacteria bacterium GW2011_GWA1_39_10]